MDVRKQKRRTWIGGSAIFVRKGKGEGREAEVGRINRLPQQMENAAHWAAVTKSYYVGVGTQNSASFALRDKVGRVLSL